MDVAGWILGRKKKKNNQALVKQPDANQWKNSITGIVWFKSIDNKKEFIFIKFDIQEFYTFISAY